MNPIAEDFYQDLPADLQDAVKRASDDTRDYISAQFETWVEEAKAELVSLGVIMCGTPTDEDVWEQKARSSWPNFYDTVGGQEWAEKFISIKDSVN